MKSDYQSENLQQIYWKLDANEKTVKWRKTIFFFSLPFFLVLFSIYTLNNFSYSNKYYYQSPKELLIIFFFSSLVYILLLIIISIFFKFIFKDQKYHLNQRGFQKTVKGEVKEYYWSDFQSYMSVYKNILGVGDLDSISRNIGRFNGDTIYLLKNQKEGLFSKFRKTIVCIDTLPENNKDVLTFISSKLPEGKGLTYGIGRIKYE